ncbi:MAG: hypothetical protein ACOY3I_10245 [Verrucomicrobiota bacterium]
MTHQVRALYADEPLGVEIDAGVYAIDSTTVDLCLSHFPWARFRKRTAAVKFQQALDLGMQVNMVTILILVTRLEG